VKRYHDLSGQLENGLWSYQALPGLEKIIPLVQIDTIATVEKDEFFASKITLSTISGTYVEAGSHILKDGKTLDEYGITDFIKPATIIRLPRQPEKTVVDDTVLAAHAPRIPKGEALIVDGTNRDMSCSAQISARALSSGSWNTNPPSAVSTFPAWKAPGRRTLSRKKVGFSV